MHRLPDMDTLILIEPGPSSSFEISPDASADSAETALIAGYALRDAGAEPAAEASFRAAMAADPSNAEARGALADLLAELDRCDEASGHFRAAVELEPSRTEWHYGLAGALTRIGENAAAQDVWRRLLERRPDNAMVHRSLARLYAGSGRSWEAIEHFREALFLDAGDVDTAVELADALIASGDPLAAVETLQPILRRSPELAAGQLAFGRAWLELGERKKAIDAFRRCLAADPADPGAALALIDRIEGDPTETMSQAYVRALFDRYAERFDEDLTIRLKYQAPQVLRAMVDQILGSEIQGSGAGSLDVLDVGCGTGLAGVAFRSLAGRLHGSDLAPRMVEKARQRGVYDHLEVGELVEGIARTPAAWDLVVAADVLVYVGDLVPVMRAAALGLRPGGLFCASVEQGGGDGFALGPARRYAHSPAYIRRIAVEAGLDLIILEEAVPRWEKGQPVPGLVFAARLP
jgi:predicted TPR repeat methyltransferase